MISFGLYVELRFIPPPPPDAATSEWHSHLEVSELVSTASFAQLGAPEIAVHASWYLNCCEIV